MAAATRDRPEHRLEQSLTARRDLQALATSDLPALATREQVPAMHDWGRAMDASALAATEHESPHGRDRSAVRSCDVPSPSRARHLRRHRRRRFPQPRMLPAMSCAARRDRRLRVAEAGAAWAMRDRSDRRAQLLPHRQYRRAAGASRAWQARARARMRPSRYRDASPRRSGCYASARVSSASLLHLVHDHVDRTSCEAHVQALFRRDLLRLTYDHVARSHHRIAAIEDGQR